MGGSRCAYWQQKTLSSTRELPGVALVNFSTGQIFMGKGNTLNYIDILIALKKLIHLCQKPANDTQF